MRGRRLHESFARLIATRAGQRWLGVVEVAGAAGLLREHTGYPAGQPMVLALAVLAVGSALWRWWATRPAALRPALAETPAERT